MNKKLNKKQFNYIKNFVESRRVKRDVNILADLYKGENGYPGRDLQNNTVEEVYGIDGGYFSANTYDKKAITDNNMPPGEIEIMYTSHDEYVISSKKLQEKRDNSECQPGLRCNWEVIEHNDNHVLQWNDTEKFL